MLKLLVALYGWAKSATRFNLAQTTWLNTNISSIFAYCAEERLSVVNYNNSHGFICKDENAYPSNNYYRFNNVGDNKPLHFIHKVNKTLSFDWLLFGDDDTCFHMSRVSKIFEGLDHNFPYFIGTCQGQGNCCTKLSEFCKSDQDLWPYGGDGYLISRGLLDMIPEAAWATCNAQFNHDGSDVRVARCIRRLTGLSLTHPEQWAGCSQHRIENWGGCR